MLCWKVESVHPNRSQLLSVSALEYDLHVLGRLPAGPLPRGNAIRVYLELFLVIQRASPLEWVHYLGRWTPLGHHDFEHRASAATLADYLARRKRLGQDRMVHQFPRPPLAVRREFGRRQVESSHQLGEQRRWPPFGNRGDGCH